MKQRSYEYCKTRRDFDPAKYETDAWFDSWCRDTLLRVDGEIYRCGTTHPVYYEGMEEAGIPRQVFRRYEHDRPSFATEMWGSAIEMMAIMQAVRASVQRTVLDRREQERAVDDHARLSAMSAMSSLSSYQEKQLQTAVERARAADTDPATRRKPDRA